MHKLNRWIAIGTLGVLLSATLAFNVPKAHAGSKGRRNVMIGAAAVTGYGLIKKKRNLAIAGAVGTGVAYHNYRAAKKRENRRRAWRNRRYSRYRR